MIPQMDSDAAHLVALEAHSHAGCCHCLSDKEGELFDGPITMVIAEVVENVMASAAEAETGALFANAQEAVAM